MKKVTIRSKIVGREGSGTGIPSPSSPSAPVDLSLYLKKEVWDDAFELKKTEDGVPYLFGRLPVLLQYGLTMYADPDNVGVPSLFDGIPIDNNTIYWEETTNADGSVARVLKAKIGTGEGGSATLLGDLENVGAWANALAEEDRIMVQKKGASSWTSLLLSEIKGTASFENVNESGEGNAYTSIEISEDKKTLTLNKGESFAKQTDYEALNTKVTDFLEGSDTDGIINKWRELESFLSNMEQSDDLAEILSVKADKGTTLEDYGITDAYTKTEIDSTLDDYVTIKGKEEITGEKNFTGGLMLNGSPIVYDKDKKYWKLTGDLLVTGALTMFANEGTYSPSTIMDAITTDNVNLKVVNGVLTFVGETGGGVADSVDWENIDGKPSWIGSTKPSYTFSEIGSKPTTLSGYGITDAKISNGVITLGANTITPLTAHQTIYNLTFQAGTFSAKTFDPNGAAQTVNIPTKTSHITNDSNYITSSYVDGKFVTIAGNEDVTGVHNFTNGLKVGGIKMSKSQSGVVFLEGNLVVSGAVTMYGTNSVTASTIMDGILVDDTTIKKDPTTKKLMLNPDLDLGGGASSWGELEGKPPYLGTTGLNYTLSIKNSAGTEQVSYNGSSTKSLTLTKSMIGLGNVENTALSTWTGSTKITTLGTVTSGTWNGSKIANAYLANSAVNISGKSVSLGGSLSQADLRTALGLGSNAYTSTSYLPLTGGTLTGGLTISSGNLIIKSTAGDTVTKALYPTEDNTYFLGQVSRRWSDVRTVLINGYTPVHAGNIGSYNAGSATKLQTARTLWGQSFDGTEKVSGNMTEVGSISMNGSLKGATSGDFSGYLHNNAGHYIYDNADRGNRLCMAWVNGLSCVYSIDKDGQSYNDLSLGTTGGALYYDASTGRWGVGTTSPSYKVHVNGTTGFSGHVYLTGASSSSSTGNTSQILFGTSSSHHLALSSNSRALIINPTSSSTTGQIMLGVDGNRSYFTSSGNFGIGTSNPSSKLHVVGSVTASALYFGNEYQKSISSAGWYRFATSSTTNNAGGTYIFFIRRSYYNSNNEAYIISCTVDFGKVHWCILNGHANTRLITQVRCTYTNNSTMYFDLYYSGTVLNDVYINAIGDCTLQKPTATTSTLTTTSTFSLTDGIKLGTTSAYPITVFRNATSGGAYIMYGANGQLTKSWAAGSDASHNFAWYYKDTAAGTDVRKMYLDSSGNLLVTGGITMYSDERKKTIIRDVELSLKQVAEAPLVEHYYNSDEKKTAHVGSIAQYWAGLNDWFCKKDDDGYYTMEIQNVALASAISVARELSRFESDTDRRIRLLEEENKRLKKEIEQLKTI